jgi:hypothetical protein
VERPREQQRRQQSRPPTAGVQRPSEHRRECPTPRESGSSGPGRDAGSSVAWNWEAPVGGAAAAAVRRKQERSSPWADVPRSTSCEAGSGVANEPFTTVGPASARVAVARKGAGRTVKAIRSPRREPARISFSEEVVMNVQFIASIAVIAADPAESRKLYVGSLGLPLEASEGSDYFHSEHIGGSKHFAVWPLSQAAQGPASGPRSGRATAPSLRQVSSSKSRTPMQSRPGRRSCAATASRSCTTRAPSRGDRQSPGCSRSRAR